ncbi:MAG: MarR family transcriptional regulator [Bacilli bacterium]
MKNDIEITKFLIYLRGSMKNMQKLFNAKLKNYGISSSHLVYMILLKDHIEGLTMTDLSNMSQVDKALTSRVMKELELKEYIYRDTKDKLSRNYKICLTEKGFDVANLIQQILEKHKKKILEDFSDKEEKQIHEVIVMLMNKLDNKKEK